VDKGLQVVDIGHSITEPYIDMSIVIDKEIATSRVGQLSDYVFKYL